MTTASEVFVELQCGKLRGRRRRSCMGDHYCAFKGIPYAKPPIGPLRFQDPEPVQSWGDVRDATQDGPMNLQYTFEKPDQLTGSEDCLYLNVYTRKVDVNLRHPVMVWIHGGAFLKLCGDEDHFGSDYFMSKDIVLVTINYRLGVFGFLNLEDEVAPGNQGLKDQVLALKWVKENISRFGGDPDNVTIFGGSAGAGSVHYLTLSPLAKGLFHKAICQSGCIFNPWALKRETQKTLDNFLGLLGYNNKRDPKSVIAFLRSVVSSKLAEAQEKLTSPKEWLTLDFPFGPCIDDKSQAPFMPVHPSILAEKGVQVPLIVGYTSFEAIFFLNFIYAIGVEEISRNFEKYNSEWLSDILRRHNLTLDGIKNIYFKGEQISDKNLIKLLQLYSDGVFVEGIHQLLRVQVCNSGAPTYFYKLSYYKRNSLTDTPYKGANHGDEIIYLFKKKECEENSSQPLQEDAHTERVIKQMIELWTNFAKTGRPTPTTSDLVPLYWLPVVNSEVLRYLNIDEELRMEKELSFSRRFEERNPDVSLGTNCDKKNCIHIV